MIAALPVVVLRALLVSDWILAFPVLCLPPTVVNVLSPVGPIIPLLAFPAFFKPEAANGMPFGVFLQMAAGFVGVSMAYSKFVNWITPTGATDPAERYRPRGR